MPGFRGARGAEIALTLLVAAVGAGVALILHLPLPWMIGPLLASAAASMAGLPLRAPRQLRNAGQWAIGTALGLYFTPQVMAVLPTLAPAIVAGSAWALLLGYVGYRWLWWAARRDDGTGGGPNRVTAFYAAAIGGASEMAVMAERDGGRVDLVAAAHSLRVLIVVVVIPFALQALAVHGLDSTPPGVQEVRLPGLALLLTATLLGVAVAARLNLPNPFVLGALVVTLAITAAGQQWSALPRWVVNLGQLFIGIALGTRFSRDFVRAAPRWLMAVAAGTLAMIVLSAAFGAALARVALLHPATAVLATTPGGIAEMAITAKVLQLGVPIVTAFHVVRYVVVLVATGPFYRLIEQRDRAAE
jgi:membrane AbrB-like protein